MGWSRRGKELYIHGPELEALAAPGRSEHNYLARKLVLNFVRFWVNLSLFFASKLLVTSAMSWSKHDESRCC